MNCAMCDELLRSERGLYVVERLDARGIVPFDLCSAECLAVMAVGEAHERGEQYAEKAAEMAAMTPAERRGWYWWFRPQ